MPSLEEGLVAHLSADATVNGVVAGRVWREQMPQEPVYPAIAFARTSTQRSMTLQGPTGLTTTRLIVDALSPNLATTVDLADKIKNSLDGVQGDLGGATVQIVYYTDSSDFSVVDGDLEVRIVSMDFSVILQE